MCVRFQKASPSGRLLDYPTEGLEMVNDDHIGRLYNVQDLMALAQQRATELGITEGGYRVKVSNADLDIGRQFCVSILGPSVADLLIEVESYPARERGVVSRTFTYRPSESLPSRALEPIELGSDSSGNPTASIEGRCLDSSGIMNEMINPLRIAVGITPDA